MRMHRPSSTLRFLVLCALAAVSAACATSSEDPDAPQGVTGGQPPCGSALVAPPACDQSPSEENLVYDHTDCQLTSFLKYWKQHNDQYGSDKKVKVEYEDFMAEIYPKDYPQLLSSTNLGQSWVLKYQASSKKPNQHLNPGDLWVGVVVTFQNPFGRANPGGQGPTSE